MITIKCKICAKSFDVFESREKTAKYCSNECRINGQIGLLTGCKNPMWKGDSASYKSIHDWLMKNFGKASKCENDNCTHTSTNFEWSLKKGCIYSHERNNYWQLCQPCHRRYDMNEERKKKVSQKLLGHKSWNNWKDIKRNTSGRFSK